MAASKNIRIFRSAIALKAGLTSKSPMPFSIAFEITRKCNSRCSTCGIWKNKGEKELSIEQLKKVFSSIGMNVPWFTITGGEPFLRKDISEVIDCACEISSPSSLNIATNGTVSGMEKIIFNAAKNHPDTEFMINFSIDGIGPLYKKTRGIDAYSRVIKNYQKVFLLKKKLKNLHLGVNIAISKFNEKGFFELYEEIKRALKPDSIIAEPATIRRNFNNSSMDFSAGKDRAEECLEGLYNIENEELKKARGYEKIVKAFRKEYYRIALFNMKHGNRAIKCFAGASFCEVLSDGEVISCGEKKISLGNLSDFGHDFRKLWLSKKAAEARKKIRALKCACTMANPVYSSIILDTKEEARMLLNILSE